MEKIHFRVARYNEINGGLYDRYSLVHFLAGMICGQLGISYANGLVYHLVFELLENTVKVKTPYLLHNYTFDSVINSTSDNIFFLLGMYTMKQIKKSI